MASDHAGYDLKEVIKNITQQNNARTRRNPDRTPEGTRGRTTRTHQKKY